MANVTYSVLQKPLEERLIDAACIYWDVAPEFFSMKGKDGETQKRHILFYMLKEQAGMQIPAIAERFEFKHKSSVFDAVENIEIGQGIYPPIARQIRDIMGIAANLDAEMVTVSVQLHSRKKE